MPVILPCKSRVRQVGSIYSLEKWKPSCQAEFKVESSGTFVPNLSNPKGMQATKCKASATPERHPGLFQISELFRVSLPVDIFPPVNQCFGLSFPYVRINFKLPTYLSIWQTTKFPLLSPSTVHWHISSNFFKTTNIDRFRTFSAPTHLIHTTTNM